MRLEVAARIIYADNNATTAVAPEVAVAIQPFLTVEYFNPSSIYEASSPANNAVGIARQSVAKLINASNPANTIRFIFDS